jgi:hypothetical protein
MSIDSLSTLPLLLTAVLCSVLAPDEPTLCVTFCEMSFRVTFFVMVAALIVNWLRAGGGTPRGPSRLKPA